jgi:hypothetical protein
LKAACHGSKRKFAAAKHAFAVIVLLFANASAKAQIGGQRSYEFLNVPSSARLAGLGGVNVSLADRDVNFFLANPALNGDTLAGVGSVNYQFYLADIGHAAITYGHDFKRAGMFTFGVQHMNYGSINGYDPAGNETDVLSASESSLSVGKSHQIGHYRLGATVKGIFSSLASYRSTAVALDLGAVFIHPDHELTIGLVIRNLGVVISDYSSSAASSKLPFDVQLGTTFKPKHMPLRFSVTGFNLTTPNVSYNDPLQEAVTSTLQRVLAHFNFGAEVLVHKNVNILVGYNYLNHQALKLDNAGGGAGISLGFSATVKNFDFVFSRMAYAAGNAGWSFTLSGNIRKLIKRQ